MDTEKLIIIGAINFFLAIFSGIGGGGGGFLGTPLLVFMGLTPQQAIATGKIGGLGTTIGSLSGLTKAKVHNWRMVIKLMLLATVIGLLAPHVITHIENGIYRKVLGIVLLLLIPVMIYKQVGLKPAKPTGWKKLLGWPALAGTMFLQAILSGGLGSLVVLTLMGLLGMSALEANVSKRFSQIILNSLIVLGLLGSGLIIWQVAATVFMTNTLGGYIGAHIALKKGDKFVIYVFAVLMFISGIELIFG